MLAHTADLARGVKIRSFSYQMAVTTQSFAAAFRRLVYAALAGAALSAMDPIGMAPAAQAAGDTVSRPVR